VLFRSDIVIPDRVIHELYSVIFDPEKAEQATSTAARDE
jgi:hypothetical protein